MFKSICTFHSNRNTFGPRSAKWVKYWCQYVLATMTREPKRGAKVLREKCIKRCLNPNIEWSFYKNVRGQNVKDLRYGILLMKCGGQMQQSFKHVFYTGEFMHQGIMISRCTDVSSFCEEKEEEELLCQDAHFFCTCCEVNNMPLGFCNSHFAEVMKCFLLKTSLFYLLQLCWVLKFGFFLFLEFKFDLEQDRLD